MNRLAMLTMFAALAAAGCGKNLKADLESATSRAATCEMELASCKTALAEQMTAKQLAERRMAAYRDLAQKFRDALGMGDLDIIIRNGRLVLQLPNKILFDSGKTEIKPEGQKLLTKVAGVIATVDRSFLIAGHTDNVAVKADAARFTNNWELSALRATTAVSFLQAAGAKPMQLGAAGYGEYMPDAGNDTPEGRAENRRLEVIVLPRLDEIPEMPTEL